MTTRKTTAPKLPKPPTFVDVPVYICVKDAQDFYVIDDKDEIEYALDDGFDVHKLEVRVTLPKPKPAEASFTSESTVDLTK